ncbi:MAG: hypothetical protein EOP10_00010 [Proteobacteria bacterium]|nr:MAG: hypothetical protein EOP10_00010 [Pseudomonadota bacterium]
MSFEQGGSMKRWAEEERRRVIEEWQNSSLTRKQFGKKHGISISCLDTWNKKYHIQDLNESPIQDSIFEVIELPHETTRPASIPQKSLRIKTSYGMILEIPL